MISQLATLGYYPSHRWDIYGGTKRMVPTDALSTVQIVSSLVATIKNAIELAKESRNLEMKSALNDIYDNILDVKSRVLDLDEENRRLKEESDLKDAIEGPSGEFGYFFYKNRPDQPLCPKCYQSTPSRVVFLEPVQSSGERKVRYCCVCTFNWTERYAPPSENTYNPFS